MELKKRAMNAVAMTPLSTARICERMDPQPSIKSLHAALSALVAEGKVKRMHSSTKTAWVRVEPRARHSVPVRTVEVDVATPCYSTAISQTRPITMPAAPWGQQ